VALIEALGEAVALALALGDAVALGLTLALAEAVADGLADGRLCGFRGCRKPLCFPRGEFSGTCEAAVGFGVALSFGDDCALVRELLVC
jgi:hypothetical protein